MNVAGFNRPQATTSACTLPAKYLDDLNSRGYFKDDECLGGKSILRAEFLIVYPEDIAKSFMYMTYTQIRSFFEALRISESSYRYTMVEKRKEPENVETVSPKVAEAKLLVNAQRLDGIVTYACARDRNSVPETFRTFMQSNIKACKTAEDVLEGFVPHFEAVLGYFRYLFPNQR